MEPKTLEYVTPRGKLLAGLAICLAAAVLLTLTPRAAFDAKPGLWAILGLLYFCIPLGICSICYPTKFVMDPEGFYHLSLFRRVPMKKTYWRDVESFRHITLPSHSGARQFVGVNFRPGIRDSGKIMAAVYRSVGAQHCIIMNWPIPEREVVETLNLYRDWALEAANG